MHYSFKGKVMMPNKNRGYLFSMNHKTKGNGLTENNLDVNKQKNITNSTNFLKLKTNKKKYISLNL